MYEHYMDTMYCQAFCPWANTQSMLYLLLNVMLYKQYMVKRSRYRGLSFQGRLGHYMTSYIPPVFDAVAANRRPGPVAIAST